MTSISIKGAALLSVRVVFAFICLSSVRSRTWKSPTIDSLQDGVIPASPDLEYLEVLPPADSNSSGCNTTIQVRKIPGLGGSTRTHGAWDGLAVHVEGCWFTHHNDDANTPFRVLSPPGGCTSSSGGLGYTSSDALSHGCDVAVNGSPFGKKGGCLGQSMSGGNRVCDDCSVWEGIPSFGLISPTVRNGGKENGNAIHSTWAIGTGLSYEMAQSMGIKDLLVGHVPGWLVRSGVALPEAGGAAAPRTALGVSKDGRALTVLVVDGCEHCPRIMGGPQGLTVADVAAEMIKLGAFHAINLDGGGSSALFHDGDIQNFPTSFDVAPIRKERKVSTVLCLKGADINH